LRLCPSLKDGLRLRHHSYDLLPVGGVIRRGLEAMHIKLMRCTPSGVISKRGSTVEPLKSVTNMPEHGINSNAGSTL
jgi:hypothetical protein